MNFREKSYDLCRELCSRHEGWEFTAGQFKYKKPKFCTVGLEVFATTSLALVRLQGIEWVKITQLTKVNRAIFPERKPTIDFARQPRTRSGDFFSGVYSSLDELAPVIEDYIDYVFPQATSRYSLENLESFVENFPQDEVFNFQGNQGVNYCILRMLIGDFDYIYSYYQKAKSGERGYRIADIERVLSFVDDMKERWLSTGKLI